MFEIEGKYTKAKIFTDNIEKGALSQVYDVCNSEAFKDTRISIMPDVHQGVGICIGFTAELTDKVIPNVVGVDIGCGMYTVELGKIDINLKELDNFIIKEIPSGFNGYEYPQADLNNEIAEVIKRLNLNYTNHERKLGTLGGGNHFIEIDMDEEGNKYLIIHSGSRNFGYKVARHYQEKAKTYLKNTLHDKIAVKIKDLKIKGKQQQIEATIQKMKKQIEKTKPKSKKSLRYLTGELKEKYLHDMRVAQKYAELNRKIIADKIVFKLGWVVAERTWQTIHNYIGADNIIRKGAVSAKQGETILIPLNMKDGSLICKGKGNADWNYSAPHGAGRKMSRSDAKEKLDYDVFKESMKDVYSTSIKKSTIDEAPNAYKEMGLILPYIKETVEVKKHIKPIYNYKDN